MTLTSQITAQEITASQFCVLYKHLFSKVIAFTGCAHWAHLKREKPPQPRNLVGAQVRELRKAARPKISQEDLCGRLARKGVVLTRTQIAKIEAGKRPVFDYEVVALAHALKISADKPLG